MSNPTEDPSKSQARVQVLKQGPYLLTGRFLFVDANGKEETRDGNIALCRCGLSKNKPFCDGKHKSTDVLNA